MLPLRRATARLTLACNNRCVFCSQDGFPDAPAHATPHAEELTFVGGEPTLAPELVERIVAARAQGASRVGIQTNGRRLADATYTAELARAGLTDMHVSLLGADAGVHDYHTGAKGSFEALWAGVAAARTQGLTVVATTVVTRSNFRVLSGLPPLLEARGVAGWQLAWPHFAGRAASGFDRVVPRFGLAVPYLLHALEAARQLALPAWVRGVPLCALGPFAARALPGEARAYGKACEDCAARESCPGVDGFYLSRFGEQELSERQPSPPAPSSPTEEALARMFVGPGERFEPGGTHAEPSPEAVRAALPHLGKVLPATAEVTPGAPRKSGEDLKEIFPQLFGGHD